jgi:uncharacterized protein (TIGR02391 family)
VARKPRPSRDDTLGVDDLHPRISEAAAALFRDGHYSEAVFKAAKRLQKDVQEKSGATTLDGVALMGLVFSEEKPIIRLGDLNTETGRNIQRGYKFLAMGVMAALRNPEAHDILDLRNPLTALERLSVMSLIRRQLDEGEGGLPTPAPPAHPSEDDKDSGRSDADQSPEPGVLDILVSTEEALPELARIPELAAEVVNQLGALAQQATLDVQESDRRGGGFKGRVAVIARLADAMRPYAEQLEDLATEYERVVSAVAPFFGFFIERMHIEAGLSENRVARDTLRSLRRMITAADESGKSTETLAATMEQNSKLASALREPNLRAARALRRYVKASGMILAWKDAMASLAAELDVTDEAEGAQDSSPAED